MKYGQRIIRNIVMWLLYCMIVKFSTAMPMPLEVPSAIYTDSGTFQESYVPAGWMGDSASVQMVEDCRENPRSGETCMKWIYDTRGMKIHSWAGVYWQFPAANWGNIDGGYDLSKAKSISFWARGKTGKEIIEFKAGGIYGVFPDTMEVHLNSIKLTREWKKYELDFSDADRRHVNGGFCWVAKLEGQKTSEVVFYLDDIWIN